MSISTEDVIRAAHCVLKSPFVKKMKGATKEDDLLLAEEIYQSSATLGTIKKEHIHALSVFSEAATAPEPYIDAVIENLRSQMESPVERLSVAVEVKGGLVQAAYANGDIFVDVYDLDVSDFPDVGEQEAADLRELDLKKLVSNPEWHTVY